jgi:hypothetical protein
MRMEIIEKFLWIAIGVAVTVPITQAFCMRGEWKRTAKLKDIYIQGCFDSVDTLVAQQLSDREQQFEYQLGVHLEEERMKEHNV